MSKLPLIAATAALGLAFVAGTTRTVAAGAGPVIPSDNVSCWYKLWSCAYPNGGYWSGCRADLGEGWIPTSNAMMICTQYHSES
jgi:hypothetical protein